MDDGGGVLGVIYAIESGKRRFLVKQHRSAPFDFCDECGRKFLLTPLDKWLCEECRPPKGWTYSKLLATGSTIKVREDES